MENINVSLMADQFGALFGVDRRDSASTPRELRGRVKVYGVGVDAFGFVPSFPATGVVTSAPSNLRTVGD